MSTTSPGGGLDPSLVAHLEPRSPAAEAYRTLRTNVQFASPDEPLRTLLATSTSPEDGKSTTLANLAITLAETGTATLLVDCDLRRPRLHELFKLNNDAGLTSYMLSGELAIQDTVVPSLRVLTSGPLPPNPAEVLASKRMAELLGVLREQATYVLYDTPPIIAVSDAAVLAPRMDGVLLVVRAGKTRRDLAQRARRMLEQVNAKIVGVVLNDARLDAAAYDYYGKK